MDANKDLPETKPLPKWRLWIRAHQTALTATAAAAISYLAGNGTVASLWQAFISILGWQ